MPSSIAELFLSQESEAGPLRDLLFRASSTPNTDVSAGPVSDRLALSYLRKSLLHAAAVASCSSTSSEVLRKFVKDSRVAVRRSLLQNPSTPPDALLELLKWACERGAAEGSEVFAQTHRLDPARLVELSRFIAEKSYVPLALSGSNLRRIAAKVSSDADAFEQIEIRSFNSLGSAMAALVLNGSMPGRSLAEVVARICRDGTGENRARKAELVREMLSGGGMLTHELIDLWDESLTPSARSRTGHLRPAALVEPGVLERLASGSRSRLDIALVNRAPERLIQPRIAEMDLDDLALVAGTLGWGYLSPLSERLVASRLLELAKDPEVASRRDRVSFVATAVVLQSESELPEDLLLGALRLGGMMCTAAWLSPRPVRIAMPDGVTLEKSTSQKVSARVLEGLVADPQEALDKVNAPYLFRYRTNGWQGVTDELFDAAALSAEHGRLVSAALGEALSGHTLFRGAKSLYPYIRSRLGADEARWEMFLEMSGNWNGSLDELIDTTELLTGG